MFEEKKTKRHRISDMYMYSLDQVLTKQYKPNAGFTLGMYAACMQATCIRSVNPALTQNNLKSSMQQCVLWRPPSIEWSKSLHPINKSHPVSTAFTNIRI